MIKTKLSAPFLAVALLLGGNAQADIIDTFVTDQGPTVATFGGTNPDSNTITGPITGVSIPGASRILFAQSGGPSLATSTGLIGGEFLSVTISPFATSGLVSATYNFSSFNLASIGNSFAIHILDADNTFTVNWFLNGAVTPSYVNSLVGAGSNFDLFAPFSAFDPTDLANATSFAVSIGSKAGGFHGFFGPLETVPEPGTLSLMALGVTGYGWARRKSAS